VPGCSETQRVYTPPDIDAVASWNINYSCDTKAGATHDSLIAMLKQRGYTVQNDYSTGSGPNYFYAFSYSKPGFLADITLDYGTNPQYEGADQNASTNPAALIGRQISGYTLELSKN
jgi:hypothetical protein